MNTDKLVSMANQIASFFRSYPEPEACVGIRDHIEQFWTPPMRRAIRADAANPALDALVTRALTTWPDAESPILKQTKGPETAGQLASDAG